MKIRTNSADWPPLISHEGQITLAFLLSFVLFVSQVTSRSQDTSAGSKPSKPVTNRLSDWIIKTNKADPSLTLLEVHLQSPSPSLENTSHAVSPGLSFTFEVQPGYWNLESLYMEIVDSKGARFRRGKPSSTNDSTFSYYFRRWPGEEQPFTLQVFSNSGDAASKTLVAEYFLESKLFQPKYTWVAVSLPFATNIGPVTLTITSLYRIGAVGNGEYDETWSASIASYEDMDGKVGTNPRDLSRGSGPIKLSISACRREPGLFREQEEWILGGLKVPAPEVCLPLKAKGEINGRVVEVLAIVGAGKFKPEHFTNGIPVTPPPSQSGGIVSQTACVNSLEAGFYRIASEHGIPRTNNGFANHGFFMQVPHVVVRATGLNGQEKFHVREFSKAFWDLEPPWESSTPNTLIARTRQMDGFYFIPLLGKAEGDDVTLTLLIQKIQTAEVIVERNPNLLK
jgi:hypothetical protein